MKAIAAAPATIHGSRVPPGFAAPPAGTGGAPGALVPQRVQKRAPAGTSAPQDGQARGWSGAPQRAQKFPSAAAPQSGQLTVMVLPLSRLVAARSLRCTGACALQSTPRRTQTTC